MKEEIGVGAGLAPEQSRACRFTVPKQWVGDLPSVTRDETAIQPTILVSSLTGGDHDAA